MITTSIQSEGDLEVVVLHETHSLLAGFALTPNSMLYTVHVQSRQPNFTTNLALISSSSYSSNCSLKELRAPT